MTYREAAETLKHVPSTILHERLKKAVQMAIVLLEKEAEKCESAEDASVRDI